MKAAVTAAALAASAHFAGRDGRALIRAWTVGPDPRWWILKCAMSMYAAANIDVHPDRGSTQRPGSAGGVRP